MLRAKADSRHDEAPNGIGRELGDDLARTRAIRPASDISGPFAKTERKGVRPPSGRREFGGIADPRARRLLRERFAPDSDLQRHPRYCASTERLFGNWIPFSLRSSRAFRHLLGRRFRHSAYSVTSRVISDPNFCRNCNEIHGHRDFNHSNRSPPLLERGPFQNAGMRTPRRPEQSRNPFDRRSFASRRRERGPGPLPESTIAQWVRPSLFSSRRLVSRQAKRPARKESLKRHRRAVVDERGCDPRAASGYFACFFQKWHAMRLPFGPSSRAGISDRQRASATGHRVWNRHPDGGFAALGTSPSRR